jgi:DNA helicase II / ATP-dependent DNA helicase PcrA
MNYIADLHIHSSYSRATSRESTLAGLLAWARIKGIQVIGTGDFTHPGWFSRLQEELEPAEPGLFRLKDESNIPSPLAGVSPSSAPVRFLLSAEISSIYKRHGAVRKVHNLLYLPDLESAERINRKLAGIGNIASDGRPILGLDSRDLLEILLEQAPEGFLVPAHIWTPWFSLFGSRSGFDAIEECYGDLTGHVFALETGLSSDPEMNRLISALDRFTLISNSDCHSPGKLGREANLFSTGLDFFSLRDALRENRRESFRGTVEFFPEEGKYHSDGHRSCGVCLDPHETRRLGLLCPVCGKPLTVGVHHRVMALADRDAPCFAPDAPEVFSLIPLPEVLGELLGVGPGSKEVLREYGRTISRFGSEFNLLLQSPLEEISQQSPLLGEAVARIRSGRVHRQPGYDGEFGVITLFEKGELARLSGQGSLFGDEPVRRRRKKVTDTLIEVP